MASQLNLALGFPAACVITKHVLVFGGISQNIGLPRNGPLPPPLMPKPGGRAADARG